MTIMKLRPILLSALLIFSSSSFANGYIGYGVGLTNVKADLTSLGGGNFDDNTTLMKLYGGFQFNKYVSIEAAYFGLAKASAGQIGTAPGAVGGSVDMSAVGLYGKAIAPLSKRTQVYLKAGMADWNADLRRNTTTASANGTDTLYGLGISYNFIKELAISADWEVIDSPNPEFSTLSVGFKWIFR